MSLNILGKHSFNGYMVVHDNHFWSVQWFVKTQERIFEVENIGKLSRHHQPCNYLKRVLKMVLGDIPLQ